MKPDEKENPESRVNQESKEGQESKAGKETPIWTSERIERLKVLWAEGTTTGEIGKQLGVSKNAVVGKAHRLALEGRPSPIKKSASSRKASARSKKKDTKIRSVVDLSAHTCRWPIGDPREPGFHFCGAPTLPNKPYCAACAAIAYVGSSSKPSRDNDAA